MLTLAGLMHFDLNDAGAYSYEQAVQAMRHLELPAPQLEQLVRRAFFNVVARNQDDHVKNIAFLMDRSGTWRLAPAYDVVYSFNPAGAWTNRHQMLLNGKDDAFTREDLFVFAETAGVRRPKARNLLDRVMSATARWPEFAAEAGVSPADLARIESTFRQP
jgi:serine/threonine-protein kinase HipA